MTSATIALPLAAAALLLSEAGAAADQTPPAAPACRPGAAPIRVEMTPSRRAGGATAAYEMRFASSRFGVAVSEAGHYLYDVEVAATGLPPRSDGAYVAWVATSDLDEWVNLGPIAPDRVATGQVGWNKFIVFVTGESSADAEAWSQEFYFSALSPSSRMHTMVGHGPFSGEPCLDPRN